MDKRIEELESELKSVIGYLELALKGQHGAFVNAMWSEAIPHAKQILEKK